MKNLYLKFKNFFNTKPKIIGFSIAGIILLAIIITAVFSIHNTVVLNNILDSESKYYNSVQISITQKMELLQQNTASSYTTEDGLNIYEDSLILDDNEEDADLGKISKFNDIIKEENGQKTTYRYQKNGKGYVLYQDTFLILNKEDLKWKEVPEEEYTTPQVFDFEFLNSIKSSDLKKKGNAYSLKNNADKIFYDILNIESTQHYSDINLKFEIENGRISKIIADYLFLNTSKVTQTYDFSYETEEITLPKID